MPSAEPRIVPSAGLALVAVLALCPSPAAAGPITLDDRADSHSVALELDALVDPTGDLGIEDVAAAELHSITDVDFGAGDTMWMRLTVVVPETGVREPWYLVIGHPREPGTLYVEEGGAFRSVPITLPETGTSFVHSLPDAPGTHRVFLRMATPFNVPSVLHVATHAGTERLEQRLYTEQGLYLGVIFAMALLNLLMGILLRDRVHLWYVAFVTSSAAYFSFDAGTVNRFLLHTAAAGDLFRPESTALVLMAVTGTQFSRLFLDTAHVSPRWDRVLRGYLVLVAAMLPVVWLAPPAIVLSVLSLSGALLPFVVIPAGVAALRAGSRYARFYLVGWSLFAAGAFVFALPFDLPMGVAWRLFQLGSALEAALLALALVDRVRVMREERAQMATAREQAEQKAAQSHKLAALGQLVAGVAHEVNNPNNFLTFNLPILRDYLEAMRPHVEAAQERDPSLRIYGLTAGELFDDAGALIGNMQHGTERITGIVSQLKGYARREDEAHWEKTDVNVVVGAAATLLENQLRKMVGRFEVDLAEGLPEIRANPGRIEQVVVNLLLNAAQAVEDVDDGHVTVRTAREDGFVTITVEDDGPGVPDAIRARIFEPFFTTKEREKGTGMGLAISHRIVEEHGGTLELTSEPFTSTRFVVRLPALLEEP